MLPTPFQCSTPPTRNVRSITHDLNTFLQNLIFQYTTPLPFETEPHSIHTIPLLREHPDSYLFYIRYTTYGITPSLTQFQVIFTLLKMLIQEYIQNIISTNYTNNNTTSFQ